MSMSGKTLVKSEVGPVRLDALYHGHSGVSAATTRVWTYDTTPPTGSWWLTPCPAIVKGSCTDKCIDIAFDGIGRVECGSDLEFLRADCTWISSRLLHTGDVVIGASGTVRVQAHRVRDTPVASVYEIQGTCTLFDDGPVVRGADSPCTNYYISHIL